MPIPKFNNVDWTVWSYKGRMTQSNTGGGAGSIFLTIPAKVYIILSLITIKAGSLGAGRTTNVNVFDDNDIKLAVLARNTSIASTATLSLPGGIQTTVAGEKEVAWLPGDIMLASGDKLQVTMAAMANAEFYDFLVRGFIYPPELPVSSTTGSTGTAAISAEENKVM